MEGSDLTPGNAPAPPPGRQPPIRVPPGDGAAGRRATGDGAKEKGPTPKGRPRYSHDVPDAT